MLTKNEIVSKILEINKYEKLNPMQELAKEHIGKNTLITTPTASGKTCVFEMYMLDCVLNKKKKAIYISPLKALTTEHYMETKKKFLKEYNLKIGLFIGDLSSSTKNLEKYDILFLTFEKMDSILRHKPYWIKDIGLLTIDEIHEIGSERGATLEIIITQLKHSLKNIVLLGLSATIKNSNNVAEWLDAKLITSNYRPVPLEIGVLFENKLIFEDREENLLFSNKSLPLMSIIKDTLEKNKQIIVFSGTRKNSESSSKKYGKLISEYITPQEYEKLRKTSQEIKEALEIPTQQCELLSKNVLMGSAFHHAGLVYKQRELIENNFKKGNIKIIFATPTLAAGINLPAYRVVITSVYRYSENKMKLISVNEFQQMAGRAGRPKYDKNGEAICVVSKDADIQKIYHNYVKADSENVESQLLKLNILRTHFLSIVLLNNITNFEQLENYFKKTFYYKTQQENSEVKNNIQEIAYEFLKNGFLEKEKNEFKITELGKKVCYLYIDPLSADNILKDIKLKIEKESTQDDKIFTINNTLEMKPYIKFKQENEYEILNYAKKNLKNIYLDKSDIYIYNKIYLTKMFSEWIQEIPEKEIIEKYNTTPGQIRDLISKANWLFHSSIELLKHSKASTQLLNEYKELKLRVEYGIRQELVQLVQLKYIGRVRARLLFNSGIRSINDIKKNTSKFITIVGKIGLKVLEELNIKDV